MNYTYMLRCADGSLYTGWTNDLERRLEAHNAGKGARYTRSRRPVELVYYDVCRINRKAVYSRGKSRVILQKQLILADFAKFRHCNNAYSRWNAGAF